MSVIEEKAYVQQAAGGDADAFEHLVKLYETPIFNLCLRLTGNREDAADMTQESFLKAWNALPRFQFESAFSTWLYRLASNTCLDHLRAQKRRPKISLTVEDETGEVQEMDVADEALSPEEAILRKEEQAQLNQALATLDVEQRQLLVLRAVNGLSYTDIAQVLGLKEGTVKSRLARARDALRKKCLYSGNKTVASPSKERKGGTSG